MRFGFVLLAAMLGICSAARLAPRLLTMLRQALNPKILRGPPSQQPAKCDDLTLIVDCGSGFTRAKLFHSAAGGDEVQVATAAGRGGDKWRQRRLVDVLIEGGDSLREWVCGIEDLREFSGAASVILGATGGLREAELEGRVTPAHMEAFRALLSENAPDATFRCLSGEEEAQAELRATQHVAGLAVPADAPRPLGMLSGGGMTAQVAHYATNGPSQPPSFLSVVVGLNPATKRMTEAEDARASLRDFQRHLASQVEATGCKGKLGGGTFIVIEMPGGLGSRDDYNGSFARLAERIGQRLLTKAEVAAALSEHLATWDTELLRTRTLPESVPSRYIATLPAELLGLLELFDDSARIYVCREWPAATSSSTASGSASVFGECYTESEPIRPDWSLGVFLDAR